MWEPYDPITYFVHVIFGFSAIAGAFTALVVRKGSPLHKKAGWVFVVPMIAAAVTALVFEVEFDEPRPLVVIMSAATLYLLATSVLALKNSWRYAPYLEKFLVIVPAVLFIVSSLALVRNIGTLPWTRLPGPALYASVFLLLVVGDVRVFLSRPTERLRWMKRHLFRMLLAFAFALRALFAIGIETGLPFEVVVTTPIVLALLATAYFFRRLDARQLP
jgi:hypothetical protein